VGDVSPSFLRFGRHGGGGAEEEETRERDRPHSP
jgi:hypothetical protein